MIFSCNWFDERFPSSPRWRCSARTLLSNEWYIIAIWLISSYWFRPIDLSTIGYSWSLANWMSSTFMANRCVELIQLVTVSKTMLWSIFWRDGFQHNDLVNLSNWSVYHIDSIYQFIPIDFIRWMCAFELMLPSHCFHPINASFIRDALGGHLPIFDWPQLIHPIVNSNVMLSKGDN